MTLFDDRRQAGMELSEYLKNKMVIGTVVVPFPEASEIGAAVAEEHDSDVVLRLSDFISAPEAPSVNIGAVTEDGTFWIEDGLRNELDVPHSHIESSARIKSKSLKEESVTLREGKRTSMQGEVVIVSDGISSGFREAAVAGSLVKNGVEKAYVVAPVKSRNSMANIESVAEKVFSLHELCFIGSSAACYSQKNRRKDKKYESKYTA
jgi:predicted phosphoribosyltransferase